ncbi:hypothetical protein A2763_00915 [Candidatus Kaiserbacteria bacterium RIFCSPHIGHO2_01_FULL_54_36]|uniref:Aminotransferase class IV n=1 Tax=Candidatus Kaiserbacteria bacterium RIFCSPHIGHO2_01_FULL_54_36 TaxID=1798482 RepID=A0A1F6CPE4_9BACT|nr:MAG: hypothetical protein A2763_00915 [Candidatus Kaiserbacteria bacterium RIFCSPHIGHO2_01_FULL_54_36]OGG75585.1 MAG: hypothetical protein A3A41_03120 [Candidatus Kaiserbacteria bacterium RIFCSPLOWO2_01_FULL_54_22]
MEFKYFSRNGKILPIKEAVVPLANIEYQYGFGVYESIRVAGGTPYFMADHVERLMGSATEIGLAHAFKAAQVEQAILELLERNAVESCNVKILLIGGKGAEDASLEILCLNPLYPDPKLYRDGVHCITYPYERPFPHAKTLSMLGSYLAYTAAKIADAYDALLLNRDGYITEGTRTNFFCLKGKTLYSPPEEQILLGVTRRHVLAVAREKGFTVEITNIKCSDISHYEGAFLTSSSSKIVPVRSVDAFSFKDQPAALKELMRTFDEFLAEHKG